MSTKEDIEFRKQVDKAAQPIMRHFSELIHNEKNRASALRYLMHMRVALGLHYIANGCEPDFVVNIEGV